jgi:hypothetical protein
MTSLLPNNWITLGIVVAVGIGLLLLAWIYTTYFRRRYPPL